MTVIWAAIDSENSPRCLLLLFASNCQSVTAVMLKKQPQLPIDCATSFYHPTPNIYVPTSIHPSIHVSPTRFEIVSSLLPCASLHPSPLWSPQKRLIQEGWAGVSELLLLCPMRRFHSTFLLLCCFYGPDMLTVQVAQSDVIQLYQLHKACLFTSLKGHVQNLDLHCHSCSVFILTMDHRKPLDCPLTNH